MQQLYLSRRNLLTLLAKLDYVKTGGSSKRTIVKQDTKHPHYPSTDVIAVTALEDEEYYTDRAPGPVFSPNEPK